LSDGTFDWTFQPGEGRYFLSGGRVETCPLPPAPGSIVCELTGSWTLRPLWKRFPGRHEYETVTCDAAPQAAAPGDWRKYLGDDFSGEAVYALDFHCSEAEKAVFLDLGKVCYAARVRLNGEPVGGRMTSPFIFEVKGLVRNGLNHLEIALTNTLANAVNAESVQEYWREHFPKSVYAPMQRSFERESLISGLLGPVALRADDGTDPVII